MSAPQNQFRIFAYFGAGAIFFALLAFIFFGAPDTNKIKLQGDKVSKKGSGHDSRFSPGSRRSSSGKDVNARAENEPKEEEDEDDSSLAGEVILKADSKEELAKLVTRALRKGGSLEGFIPSLLAARLQFPSRQAAADFRDSLDDENLSDSNYTVLAPDFPQIGDGDGGDRGGDQTGTTGLQPFGDRALEFLGVEGDNSNWGEGVVVAILDSGVYAHESLRGININQIDLVQTPEDPQADYTGHGTAVADIVHTVAPAANLLSVRVLDSDGVGDTFTVAQGVIAAADQGVNVINLSLGSYGDSSVLRDAITYATDKGISVVAATGNDGIEQVSYPAAYDNVIGVTAVDASGEFADFSNYGESVDIGAPGVGVRTAWQEDEIANFSGTSAASPFVAGAIAAEISRNEGYTTGQAQNTVEQSAQDAGEPGVDSQTGSGVLYLGE